MYDVCNNNKQGGLAGQIGTDVFYIIDYEFSV